ncbi:hypothetical protein K7432_003333 [Basidiobolus ranarum]|uniref:Uncharacterized protein n=1 Tax=Basidiobolus ranarum TaxID=34480 RepID=A0ABR2X025_9FUNG
MDFKEEIIPATSNSDNTTTSKLPSNASTLTPNEIDSIESSFTFSCAKTGSYSQQSDLSINCAGETSNKPKKEAPRVLKVSLHPHKSAEQHFRRELEKLLSQSSKIQSYIHTTSWNQNAPERDPWAHDILDDIDNIGVSTKSRLDNLKFILFKYRELESLPLCSDVLNELAIPFYTFPLNVGECMKALDIYEFIRINFLACGAQNYYSQIIWCCQQLIVPHPILRFRVVSLFEKVYNSILTSALHPIPSNIIYIMIINCVKLLVSIKTATIIVSNQIDKEQDRFIPDKIQEFFKRLYSGRTVTGAQLKPDAIKEEGYVKSYESEVFTRYLLIDGLVRCLRLEEAPLRSISLDFLAEFMTPKLEITSYYEQILSRLVRIASGVLQSSNTLDINNQELALATPYKMIILLNTSLPQSYENLSSATVDYIAQAFINGFLFKESVSPHPVYRRGSTTSSPTYDEDKGLKATKNNAIQFADMERCIKDRLICIWNSGHKASIFKPFQKMVWINIYIPSL